MNISTYKDEPPINLVDYDLSLPDLIGEISDLTHGEFSIYLRGSYANLSRTHAPWDMDIYLVVSDSCNSSLFPDINTTVLNEKYYDLPDLDLTIFTKDDLFHSPGCLLQRLLLIYGGRLAGGVPLMADIPRPVLNQVTADGVKKIMFGFISKKFPEMLYSVNNGENNRAFLMKKVAKMLIRTGVFLGISQQGTFSRDIEYCLTNLTLAYPDLRPEIDYIFNSLSGEGIDTTIYLKSVTKIRDRVYYEY